MILKLTNKIQNRKQANHVGHIIAAQYCQRQNNYVERCFSLINNSFNSQKHQREECHCVEPHNIPVICYEISAEGIEHTESGGYLVIPAKGTP